MRLTYKSPHGGYGYNQDVDFYSNEVKNYIGQMEDVAEMSAIIMPCVGGEELREQIIGMLREPVSAGTLVAIASCELDPEKERLKAELAAMANGERRKWIDIISQFLQDSGFEEASKALDCKYEL